MSEIKNLRTPQKQLKVIIFLIFPLIVFFINFNANITIASSILPPTSIINEGHRYTLHTIDSQGGYYYVEKFRILHRYYPETGKWDRDLFTVSFSASSIIKIVHATQNDYLFVGLRNGTLFRSIDGGQTFTVSWQWTRGGYFHTEWSIASDDAWILIGEYGPKNTSRRVCASNNWGDTWTVVYETSERLGVHIHRVDIDSYSKDWWITVGDDPVAGRVMYSRDEGIHWGEVECPETGYNWQPYQPCNILFFEHSILIINEPFPQVFSVNRTTMVAEYISDIGNFSGIKLAAPYSAVAGKYGIYVSIVRTFNDPTPQHSHSTGIFVSYDTGFTWQQLINFTELAAIDAPSIEPSDVYGAHPLIYADGYIHARWIVSWGKYAWESEPVEIDGGWAIKFRDAYYGTTFQKFPVILENITYPVVIQSSSFVNDFNFNTTPFNLNFSLSSADTIKGHCNTTIPKSLIQDNLIITIDEVPLLKYSQTENKTHISVYFQFKPISTSNVSIIEMNRYHNMTTKILTEDPVTTISEDKSPEVTSTEQSPESTTVVVTEFNFKNCSILGFMSISVLLRIRRGSLRSHKCIKNQKMTKI